MDLQPKGVPWDQDTFKRIERKGGCHYRATCVDYIELERKIEARELRYADRVEVYGADRFQGKPITDCVVVLNGGQYMSTGIKEPEPTEQERYDSISVTGSGRQVEDDEDPTDINPNRRDPVVERVAWDVERKCEPELCYYREPSPDIEDLERRIAGDTLQDQDVVFLEDTGDVAHILADRKYMILQPVERVSYSGDRRVYAELSETDEAMRVSLGMTRAQWETWNHGGGWSKPKPITGEELRNSALYWLAQAEDSRRRSRVWFGVAFASLLVLVGVLLVPNEWIYMLFRAFE